MNAKTSNVKLHNGFWKLMILCISVLTLCGLAACGKKVMNYQVAEVTTEAPVWKDLQAAIKYVDLDQNIICLMSLQDGQTYLLRYHGGVDVRDKYGEIMSALLLKEGQLVEISYNENNQKLQSIHVIPEAWERKEVTKVVANIETKEIAVEDEFFHYDNDRLLILSGGNELRASELCSEDQVTVRGIGNDVFSISVDLGHGYVRLTDYDTYIGGMIEIGYDVIVPVTEDMLIPVREGSYKLRINKGVNSGYKNIVVTRDEETEVSLKELQIEEAKKGSIFFQITPADAKVQLDGVTIDTSQTYDLTYGRHRIVISCDGYTTKSGFIKVSSPYKIYKVSLSKEDESSTQDQGTTATATFVVLPSTEALLPTTTQEDEVTTAATKNTTTVKSPQGVKVYLDGTYMGEAPVSFTKQVGSHIITLCKSGYIAKSYTIMSLDDGNDEEYQYDELVKE